MNGTNKWLATILGGQSHGEKKGGQNKPLDVTGWRNGLPALSTQPERMYW